MEYDLHQNKVERVQMLVVYNNIFIYHKCFNIKYSLYLII